MIRRLLYAISGRLPCRLINDGDRPYLERMGYLGKFSGHGFRSTASTLLHEMGWRSEVIERQLAHAERDKVKAAYNHAEYMPERREMMQAWADWVDGLGVATA